MISVDPKSHIFILTGAGISKESGLDTFRDEDGIWQKYKIENVATPEAFARNPDLVHEFYNGRRRQLSDPAVVPNAAHMAIAQLQNSWAGRVTLVTQNIDDLHDRALEQIDAPAGSIAMHGRLYESLCAGCGHVENIKHDLSTCDICAACGTIGFIRPNIVWFGEMPYHIQHIFDALSVCDYFLSIGTSGTVYPAAGFVAHAKSNRCKWAIEMNVVPSEINGYFDESVIGQATQTVPKLLGYWIEESKSRASAI